MDLKEFQELSNTYTNGEERNKLKNFLTSPPVQNNRKTIVFSTPSETGTSFFRVLEPMFSMMRQHPDEFNLIYTEAITPAHFKIADLIVMHRADQRHSFLIDVAKKYPKTEKTKLVLHDVDDNEFQLPKSHSMRELWFAFKKDQHSLFAIQNSDHVNTTGRNLAQVFKKYNSNVKIFRNFFNWKLPHWNRQDLVLQNKEKYKGKVVLGYCGLSSHETDLKKLSRIWKVIHDKYPHTHFIVSGVVTVDIMYNLSKNEDGSIKSEEQKITDPEQTYKGRILKIFNDFDKDRIEFQDSKDLENWGEFYTQYDINCVFVERNTFNKCKSSIKVVEGLHYENIPVFSQWGPYEELYETLPVKLRNTNIACNTEGLNEWVSKISYWIENIDEGRKYVKDLKKFTDEFYDMDSNIGEKVAYFQEILEKHEDQETLKVSKYVNIS